MAHLPRHGTKATPLGEVARFGEFADELRLNEALLLLEDAGVPVRDRLTAAISALSSMSDSAKRRLLPYIVSMAMALGPSFDLRSEVMAADPAAVSILDGGPDLSPVGLGAVDPGPSDSVGMDRKERHFPVYGYNLRLSDRSAKWLRGAYINKSSTAKETQRFGQALSRAKDGVAKIFNDWKGQGIHIRLSQDMYDAIVMIAVRSGVNELRLSEFIQDVKMGKHLQASKKIAGFTSNIMGVANVTALVKKEAALYTSYLKAEISAKKSGVGVEVPSGYTVHGIDVSKYQGAIDWESVKKLKTKSDINIDFVFVKATRGDETVDPKFARNWAAADKHGLARGAYHYFSPGVSGLAQAKNFIKTVTLLPGDLPPVLDWEEKGKDGKTSRKEALAWLRAVEKHYGVRPIIYTGAAFYSANIGPGFDVYPLWVSHGPFGTTSDLNIPGPAVSRKWAFWQFSDKARVSGIKGDVDLNVFNGSKAQLNAYLIRDKEARSGASDTSKARSGAAKRPAKSAAPAKAKQKEK